MIDSKRYYNKIASQYDEMLAARMFYLLAVEDIIVEKSINRNIIDYLDLGCGNAVRSKRIIDAINPDYSILLDESSEMIAEARRIENKRIRIIEGDFLNFDLKESFGLITCLWNVFGHLESKSKRFDFLKKMHTVLDRNGLVFIDVNNRYNVRNYGLSNVLKNVIKDLLNQKSSGKWKLNTNDNSSTVYIHNPFELDGIIRKAGFTSFEKIYIDYSTGKKVRNFLGGQLLYCIAK